MELSIIIPALNEEKTIAICVRKAMTAINKLKIEGEVLVADNGSTDNTVRIAQESGARVVHIAQKGYGSVLMGGFKEAKGTFLIMGDADDSYNFEEIAPFYHKLKEGYSFVMGNRFKGTIEQGANPFLHRYLGTPVLTALMNMFFKTGIGDVNCGMRGLTKQAFYKMRLRATGMEFATEMIVKASLRKLKISEVPCNLYKDKRGRKPHLNVWRDGWRHLRFMLLFTPTWTYIVPGSSLFIIGALGMLTITFRDALGAQYLSFLPQKHIFSFMTLFLLGAQILGLGVAAHAFSFSKYFDYASKSVKFLQRHFRLERGIVAGAISFFSGISIFSYLFISYCWRIFPFLTDALRLELAAFGIAFVILGVQAIYTSFLISLFYLKVK